MAKEEEAKSQVPATINDAIALGQEGVPYLLKTVTEKIAAIRKGMPAEPKTKGELKPFGKIQNINDVPTLIRAHSMVVGKEKAYKDSAKALGVNLTKYPCKLFGHSPSSWITDIKARIIVVAHKKELETLNKIKAKLEENLSKEEKFKKDMNDIMSLLQE